MRPTLLINILNKAINKYLALDPETAVKMQQLAGKVVLIEVTGWDLELEFLFTSQGIQILPESTIAPHTTIKGTPSALFKMALGPSNASSFLSGKISIAGDLELGQQVKDLLDHLDIDWEEQAAQFIGDVPAHQLGNLLRTSKSWVKQTAASLRLNLQEYLQEEKQLFVTRAEHNDFCHDVSALRDDVERLIARVALLKKKGE